MQTPQELAFKLAKAYALTEILPLRHSTVQEALEAFSGSMSDLGFRLDVRDGGLWARGGRVEASDEVSDLADGLGRCGITVVKIAAEMDSRTVGTFLDTVRIASISGHVTNLHELVAFHPTQIEVSFGAPAAAPSELTQSAGAIFAGALAGTEADSGTETKSPPEGGPNQAPDVAAPTEPDASAEVDPFAEAKAMWEPESVHSRDESTLPEPSEWDPPGTLSPAPETEDAATEEPTARDTAASWTQTQDTQGEDETTPGTVAPEIAIQELAPQEPAPQDLATQDLVTQDLATQGAAAEYTPYENTSAVEDAPEARDAQSDQDQSPGEAQPPQEDTLAPKEFGKGVALFMSGAPDKRRAWAVPLSRQAARVDVESDLAGTLDIVIELLGKPGQEPDESVTEVAKQLVRPVVAQELALRLGSASDEDERGILLQVAGQIGDAVAHAFAEELAVSEDRAARRSLVHALTFLGEASLAVVEDMVDREEWYVVRNAVTVLSVIGGPATLERLAPCLSHVDSRVRRETVMALAKLGGDRAGHLVLEALDDRDADVRAAATMVAGSLKAGAAAPILRARLAAEENESVVIEALRTLGKLGDAESLSLIKKRAVPGFFSRPSKAVRIAAYRALGAIRSPEAVRLLEEATEDRDPEIRAVAQVAMESQS